MSRVPFLKSLDLALWAVPFVTMWAWQWVSAYWLLGVLLGVLIIKTFIGVTLGKGQNWGLQRRLLMSTCLILGSSVVVSIISPHWAFLLYPAVVSGIMGGLFFYSLLVPPCLIGQFALAMRSDVPEEAWGYLSKVTLVWGLFCWMNMTTSLIISCYGTKSLWLFYNGGLSYGLMGLLFVGEYGVRCFYKAQLASSSKK